jgi:FHA domain
MAATMMCPAHGPVIGEYCSTPGCFEVLRPHIGEPPPPAAAACQAPGCGMDLPCPLHPEVPTNDGRGAARTAAAYVAASAAAPQLQSAVEDADQLQFPWGPVTVPADGLIVGRDYGESCGAQIDAYDNVSRRHARISVESGLVFVEDLDSTNGTTVNGGRITPRQPTPVKAGDVLGFGNRLNVAITAREHS